jgi:hypothetical protein
MLKKGLCHPMDKAEHSIQEMTRKFAQRYYGESNALTKSRTNKQQVLDNLQATFSNSSYLQELRKNNQEMESFLQNQTAPLI